MAPDCIGFGGSDKPRSVDIHTFDFHSDNLEIFVRELGFRKIVLVGHELNGRLRHPDLATFAPTSFPRPGHPRENRDPQSWALEEEKQNLKPAVGLIL